MHIATFTSLAFVVDPLLIYALWRAAEPCLPEHRYYAIVAQLVFMFGFTKIVKLVGLFRRNPGDIIFLPVSILFGYFHGLIKLYALFTLQEVSYSTAQNCPTNLRLIYSLSDIMGKPCGWRRA